VEEGLDEELVSRDLGEVTGGAVGAGFLTIDVEVNDLEGGLDSIRRVLRRLAVPESTYIEAVEPEAARFSVYGDDGSPN
jgi:hypothetical protein